jgi:protein STU2
MGDEEDFSSLPLPDRFVHKNWKVRKEGYEAAAKEFDIATSESDPVVRQFINDASIWKGVVGDSNVAAQQEGLAALCSFLQIAGTQGCTRFVRRPVSILQTVDKQIQDAQHNSCDHR